MQSSRDSSIWRSLAVAFGDGLAFGVGVKLAQGPQRPAAGAPALAPIEEATLFGERLEQIEQRLAHMEQAPTPAVMVAPPAPAPFDQKVLEAVVNALDARLKEQAGQVERRLTELEARIAIELKSLEQQDHSIVKGLEGRLAEVHSQYNEHVLAIRDAVAEDMDALYGQIGQLRQEVTAGLGESLNERVATAAAAQMDARMEGMEARAEERLEERMQNALDGQIGELRQEVTAATSQMDARIEGIEARLEERLEERMQNAVERAALKVSAAAADRLEGQLTPVHAALEEKNREIAELRQRAVDGEQTVLDLILAMGDMCRQVAQRISSPALAESEPPAVVEAAAEVEKPPEEPPSAPTIDPPTENGGSNGSNGNGSKGHGNGDHGNIEPMPFGVADTGVPSFAPVERTSRLWRIPLVSSFLILAAGSWWVLK